MAGDEPILLVLVRGVLHVIGWVCSVFAFPTVGGLCMATPLVEAAAFKSDGLPVAHALLAPVRLLIGVVGWIFLLTAWVPVVAYLAFKDGDDTAGFVVAATVAAVFMQVYGVCYLRRQMEWARDFNPFRVCAIALCQGLVDVAAMLGLCIGVVSILQIPSILSILVLSLQSERGYRRELRNLRMTLLLQPVYAFVDWLCLPCALSLLACVWRWPVVKKELGLMDLRPHNGLHSFSARGIIGISGLLGALEIIGLLLCMLISVFAPWRLLRILYFVASALADGSTDMASRLSEAHEAALREAGRAILDFLTLIPLAVVALTLYRLPNAAMEVVSRIKAMERDCAADVRGVILIQAFLVFADIFMLLCVAICVPFVYRLPLLWDGWVRNTPQWDGLKFQTQAYNQAWMQIIDIPFIIFGVLVSLLLWRSPFMWRSFIKLTDASSRRELVCRHLLYGLLDFIDVWFLILGGIICVTIVRAPRLSQDVREVYKFGDNIDDMDVRHELRLVILLHAVLWVLDLPAVVLVVIMLGTLWRSARIMRIIVYGDKSDHNIDAEFEADLDDELKSRVVKRRYDFVELFGTHRVVMREFCFWLLDIFIIPLLVVLLVSWRAPSYLKALVRLWRDPDTSFAERVHFTTAQHAIALGIDIPFVLCGVLCLWRIPALLYHLCTECENKEWPRRQAAARYLGYALLDIPTSVAFVLLHALVIIAPWEVANMWKDFRAYKRGDNEHLIVAMHLGYAILDTPVVLGGVLASIMAPWRAWDLVAAVYAAKKRSTGQDLVGLHLFMAVADWVCAVLACVIAVTLVRLQHLLYVLESRKWWTQPAGIERCAVFYSSTLQVSLLLVLDSMSFAQVLVVAVGVVRLPSMLTRIVNTFSAYSRARGELLRRQRHFHDAGGDVNGNGNGAGGNGNVNARSASPVGDAHSADGRPVVSEREPRDATMRRSSSARDRARSDVALVVAERPPPRTMTKEFLKSTLPKDEPVQSAGILLWAGNVAHSDTLLGFQCQCGRDVSYAATRLASHPATWSLVVHIVNDEVSWTMTTWGQLLRLPFKLVAAVMFGLTRAIAQRFDPKFKSNGPDSVPLRNPMEHSTASFLTLAFQSILFSMIWLLANPLGLDATIIPQLFAIALWALHDVAYVPLLANIVFLAIITLGAPLGWGKKLVATSLTNYNRFERVMTGIYAIQVVMVFVFLALQVVLLFVPTLLYHTDISISDYLSDANSAEFWKSWFDLPPYMWCLQALWTLSYAIQVHLLVLVVRKAFAFQRPKMQGVRNDRVRIVYFFHPIKCFTWVISHVLQGRVWGLYKMLLGAPTAWFRTWRIGLFKNLALIVVYCVWCGWPFGIAMWVDRVWAWVIAGVVCLLFVWRGYIVVEDNWKAKSPMRPQTTLRSIQFSFPDPVRKPNGEMSHRSARVQFTVENLPRFGPTSGYTADAGGAKAGHFSWPQDRMFQVELEVEGEAIWSDLKSVYGRFGVSLVQSLGFHPFQLCPKYMDPRCVTNGVWTGVINVDMRQARRRVNFAKVLSKLQNRRDSMFTLNFNFGFSKNGRFDRKGKLFSVETRASAIWRSHVEHEPLPGGVAAVRGEGVSLLADDMSETGYGGTSGRQAAGTRHDDMTAGVGAGVGVDSDSDVEAGGAATSQPRSPSPLARSHSFTGKQTRDMKRMNSF